MKLILQRILIVCIAIWSIGAMGQSPPSTATMTAEQDTAKAQEMVEAEVRKVDKDAGKVTLKHGEIKSLDMPAMTMVFRVNDPTLWNTLTEGAKVRVVIEKRIVGYAVIRAEPMP